MSEEAYGISEGVPGSAQSELPFALVWGEPLSKPPQDLYIPPDALEVFLEAFEGPLDLLLYLIKRQNLNILDIPIADVTKQYVDYIALMQELRLELAAEYLVMAAVLAEIKSRMLLPRPAEAEDDDADPRAELVRRLQEYERIRIAAENLDALPRMDRDWVPVNVAPPTREAIRQEPEVDLREILHALREVMSRAQMYSHHHIQREPLSVRERMARVLERIGDDFIEFTGFFSPEEGRRGVVVTLLALLELLKDHLIELVQNAAYMPIYVKRADR